jgi:DNA-binding response OmpR family regulator
VPPTNPTRPHGRAGKILVVDDEPLIRAQIGQTLKRFGHEIIEAGRGGDALTAARAEKPDLILLDLIMPDMTGIAVCEALRADPATQDIRIIVISGMDAKQALEESVIAGADDFLAKPIDALELSVRVRSILRVRNIHDDERRVEAYIRNLQDIRQQQAQQ